MQALTESAPAARDGERFADWIPVRQLPELYPDRYKTEQAALWVVRVFRADLEQRDALALICGRMYVHPARFEAAIIAGGQRLAKTRAA